MLDKFRLIIKFKTKLSIVFDRSSKAQNSCTFDHVSKITVMYEHERTQVLIHDDPLLFVINDPSSFCIGSHD